MQNGKIARIYFSYDKIFTFPGEYLQLLQEVKGVELTTYIKQEEYEKLSEEDKEKLRGFTLLEKESPVYILKKIKPEDVFPKEVPTILDSNQTEINYRKKHLKKSKPYAPKKMFNPHFNSRKKGGR